jgi:hypothetical protein
MKEREEYREAASNGKKIFLCDKVKMELYSTVSSCMDDLL